PKVRTISIPAQFSGADSGFHRLPRRVSVPSLPRAPAVNRLLEALPSGDRRRVFAECETVELVFGDVLYKPWARLSHVYFPTTSFISLIMPVDGSGSLEVGLVGNEGMFGIPLVLGVDVS